MIDNILHKIRQINEETKYNPSVLNTLNRIEKICKKSSGKKNSWYVDDRLFFIEWPELASSEDEFVSGDIFEKVGVSSRLVGRYKISKSGDIIKFPFFKDIKKRDD